MLLRQSLILCAAAACASFGCEHHHHDDSDPVVVRDRVTVDEPRGEVVEGPGVVPIDVEPDPAQRVYVYDQGYPPGTYTYNNDYYYGGYRYPHDVFVNQYVQENVRQHRYVSVDDNRRQGRQIEQTQRTTFVANHGVSRARTESPAVRSVERAPVRAPEAPRPTIERPENRRPANEEHRAAVQPPVNRTPTIEERRPAGERPAVERPAGERPTLERPAVERPAVEPRAVERPQSQVPTNQEHRATIEHPENRPAPANEPRKPGTEEPRREEPR